MKFLKRTCPKCGAKVDSVTGDNDEILSFKCGSDSPVHGAELSTQSDICKELCELRSKLTPERAEQLEWTQVDRLHMKSNCDLLTIRMVLHNNGEATLGGDVFGWFDTIDAAKAHAEELHQKAFRELLEKWGKK